MPYPPHVPAHAEPSAAAYHVHCPACGTWVAGAVAHAIGPDLWAVACPRCGSSAPGRINPDCELPFGPYSGRAVSSLRTSEGRDYLDYLLHTMALEPISGPVPAQGLRLAILWHLGWLSAERAHVDAGPNVQRLREEWNQWLRENTEVNNATHSAAATETRPRRPASWLGLVQAEQERLRGGRPRRQQFHQYQRPAAPPPPDNTEPVEPPPAWVAVLGIPWPVTSEQVRRAHHRLSKRHHPDVGGSAERMQQINQARDQAEAWLRTKS
ncbi:hypothetical protein [Hymenobacter sp. YC55]|uniref:hypothetical protein n=1 Tax=Hymenobacter sp. YC55 TaxID=3034019 RepID=UPI0023F644C4|nr:hypothetical protein [Hymenobacter sp. YC55]MDF7815271.1 hypothetical protein [Hymenobacter sp. YC55]